MTSDFSFGLITLFFITTVWAKVAYFKSQRQLEKTEQENQRLHNLITKLVTPKPKPRIKEFQKAFEDGGYQGYQKGYKFGHEKGREYQILHPDEKIEIKIDET